MTQDEIIEMARQAGFLIAPNAPKALVDATAKHFDQFAKLVAEKEREACAMLCLWHNNTLSQKPTLFHMAQLIRERGQT